MMIREINPEIRYKSLTTTHNPLAKKIFRNRSKKNHSRNNSCGSATNNISSVHHSNLEIEDVLSNVKSNKKNVKTSTECKILDIDPNKNLSLPQSIAERYFTDHNTLENEDKNLLPDVFVSINKSIEHDANTKGFNYIYNNISSLQTMREREMGASLSPKKNIEDNSSSFLFRIIAIYRSSSNCS